MGNIFSENNITETLGFPLDNKISLNAYDGQVIYNWAKLHGVTHYAHWFQPLHGGTSEKQDFLHPGVDLLSTEVDGSSFPNGGLRETAKAQGVAEWDGSDAFIWDHVLMIPSYLRTRDGKVLDYKTPLERSRKALTREVTRMLRLIEGDSTQEFQVEAQLGPEQEFFLIEKSNYMKRPDLRLCGRSLFGERPLRGQELEDHYFSRLSPRVSAFMEEASRKLEDLGIKLKTQHTEVAPCQFELTPFHTEVRDAVNNNLLMMETLNRVADRYNLVCLFHEKPFFGVNGSGKHNNWSLSTKFVDEDGEFGTYNLFDPVVDRRYFFAFLAAFIQGVSLYGDLLRASIAVPGNDYRLGANEAPPPIMSIYLGEELTQACKDFMETGDINRLDWSEMRPEVDRNRTSPLAFAGNRFEFRSVGSSQNCALPMYHLNMIMADSLREMCDKIESRPPSDMEYIYTDRVDRDDIIMEVVQNTLKEHFRCVFNGNGYSSDWLREAAERKLPILRTPVDALRVYQEERIITLFERMKILDREELKAFTTVRQELFMKTLLVETRVIQNLITNTLLPLVSSYRQTLLSQVLVNKTEKAYTKCVNTPDDVINTEREKNLEALKIIEYDLITVRNQMRDAAINHSKNGTTFEDGYSLDKERIDFARVVITDLERRIPSNLWPFPKYDDLLEWI